VVVLDGGVVANDAAEDFEESIRPEKGSVMVLKTTSAAGSLCLPCGGDFCASLNGSVSVCGDGLKRWR